MKNNKNICRSAGKYGFIALLCLIALGCTQTHSHPAPDKTLTGIEVKHGWVRAMPPVAKNSAAYMKLNNHSNTDDRLLSVSSSISEKSEIHTIVSTGEMLSMKQVKNITVPANGSIELKPGNLHIMLLKLKKPINNGDRIQIVLNFEKAGSLSISLPARENAGMNSHNMDHGTHNMNH